MSNWQIQTQDVPDPTTRDKRVEATLVSPGGQSYVQQSEEAAKAIKGEIDQLTRERDELKAKEAALFLDTKDAAMLQAAHDFEDYAKKMAATVRGKKAMGERLS